MYPHLKQDLGPPEPPKMRSTSEPGQRKVSIFRADDRHYPATARMSSDLLRPACAALSANEPTEWICGRVASRKEAIPKERYAAGEKGPAIGTWRETGAGAKPPSSGKGFNLAKYKAAAQPKPPQQGAYPQGQESRFSSPQAAFDAAKDHQQEPRPTYPQGLDEPGF